MRTAPVVVRAGDATYASAEIAIHYLAGIARDGGGNGFADRVIADVLAQLRAAKFPQVDVFETMLARGMGEPSSAAGVTLRAMRLIGPSGFKAALARAGVA